MKNTIRFAAAALLAVLVATPVFAARGTADFTRFVTLGDSYGAGFSSSSLNERHQVWSWPAVIARQAGLTLCLPGAAANAGCFAQPLVSFPGISNELVLNSLIPSPVIAPAPGQAQPLMTTFARPYNNLSIPGATIGALLTLTGAEPQQPGEPTAVSFGRLVLRGQGTAVQQAIAQNPTFIALWIGGNEYLNILFSGTPATITPAAEFRTRYEALLDQLIAGAPNAGMVVGNLPASIPPYLRLIQPFLVDPATGQQVLVGGQPVFYMVQNEDGTITPITSTTLIPLQTRAKLALGYGLPEAFRNIPPFSQLPNVGQPLSPNDVITAAEIQQVFARVAEYNTAIQAAAAARNIPVADINGLFQRVSAGMQLGPITVTGAPVVGGFFSFDFFHLTDLGYMLFANEYIRTINNAYGTEMPVGAIWQLFQNNGAFFGDGAPGSMSFTSPNSGITDQAVQQITTMWAQPTIKRTRFRAVTH